MRDRQGHRNEGWGTKRMGSAERHGVHWTIVNPRDSRKAASARQRPAKSLTRHSRASAQAAPRATSEGWQKRRECARRNSAQLASGAGLANRGGQEISRRDLHSLLHLNGEGKHRSENAGGCAAHCSDNPGRLFTLAIRIALDAPDASLSRIICDGDPGFQTALPSSRP